MGLMEKIFGDLNEKEVKKVSKIADKVMEYEAEMEALTDEQLRKQLAGHLCRCTGYENIFRAVRRALDETLGK